MKLFLLLVASGMWINRAIGAILDSRCYLEGGGSAENFLVSEDAAVGSAIGALKINGDPNKNFGDISLDVREQGSAVKIETGTKKLVLVRELDKEGLNGPSSIYVNIICTRKHSSDPSFVIPVNVRVTDVNDNAPQWIGGPYSIVLSEVTVIGTRILQGSKAVDDDQQGPFSTVEYRVLPGPNAEFVQFLNTLEGTLVLKKQLDFETMSNFTIKLRAQDQGVPPKYSDTNLYVHITDADDQNPKFLQKAYSAELGTNQHTELQILPEPIKAIDQDLGICSPIKYSIVDSPEAEFFEINENTGVINLNKTASSKINYQTTLVIKAMQIDNPDRYAYTTVLVRRQKNSTNMRPTYLPKEKYTIRVQDVLPGSQIFSLPHRLNGKLRYIIMDSAMSDYIQVGEQGEIILNRIPERNVQFDVFSSNEEQNMTIQIDLQVMKTNEWEPRFRKGHYEFNVLENVKLNATSLPLKIGQVEAADGDKNDVVTFSIAGENSSLFKVDPFGSIFLLETPKVNRSTIQLVITATDSGQPSKSTSVPATIYLPNSEVTSNKLTMSSAGVLVSIILTVLFSSFILCCYCLVKRKRRSDASQENVQPSNGRSPTNLLSQEKLTENKRYRFNSAAVGTTDRTNFPGNAKYPITNCAKKNDTSILEKKTPSDDYTATVKSIISRVSLQNRDLLPDKPWNEEATFQTEGLGRTRDSLASAEDNLTVYF